MADIVLLESFGKRRVTLNGTVARFDLLAHDGTNWVQADADSSGTYAQLVAHQAGVSGEVIEASPYAVISDADAPYTQDAIQYLSGTAGAHTETAPSGAADLVQSVGVAQSDEIVEINIRPAREVTVTLGKPFMLASAADLVQDTGPAAGTVLTAASDSATYVWYTPRNCVDVVRVMLGWSANITLDASDTYTVSVSSAATGEANDATTDSIAAAAFTVTADEVAETDIVAGFDAAGIPTPGEWVHVDIDKAAEGTAGDDPVLYSIAVTYKEV